ncbi:MAG: signal peptidase I [Clostridia bacterium]
MPWKHRQKKPFNLKKEILGWGGALAVALVAVFLVHTFLFMMIRVDGRSMQQTLQDGDRIASTVLDMKLNGPTRGTIVLCRYPGNDYFCVKRLIGMPGDTLKIVDGVTYIDGQPLQEPYVAFPEHGSTYGPIHLSEDQYFVMGDNRANSLDSRSASVGPLKRDELIANVRLRLWPLDRIGMVNAQ